MNKTTSGVWVCPNPHVAFFYTQHETVIEEAKKLDCVRLYEMKHMGTTRITLVNVDPLLAQILHTYLYSFSK